MSKLISMLTKALKALADKGENVPLDRVTKRLETAGVRQDEIDAAGIPSLLSESPTVTTRSGNEAVTPETIRNLDAQRYDRDAVDTDFLTVEEKSRDQYSQLIDQEMADVDFDLEDNFADSQAYLDDEFLREQELAQELEQARDMLPDTRVRDFFENVSPEDVDDNDVEIMIWKDPRDVSGNAQESKHFGPQGGLEDIQRDEISYHARFAEEDDAINVFEMQSDLTPTEGAATQIAGVPEVNVSKNIINRMVALAVKRDKKEVKFFIGNWNKKLIIENPEVPLLPENYTYFDEAAENGATLFRSPEIQNHYSTVIAGQIKSIAEKIGARVVPDNKGYLILTLPAAGFTLPLYAEEDRESSFIATSTVRGNDPEEAREYLNNKQPQSPPPLPEGRSVRGDFNTGGKVLRSLGRTRRAEGGPPHRGYFKPVKELLTDNKDKEFVRRVLNPALNDALKRDKSVASNETHRMAAEVDDKTGNWFVYPTVVNKGGTLTKPANPMQAALDSGEYISFGKDKDQAVWLAADNYKIQEFKEHVKKAAP